ncbi:MAG: hypothetical protein H7A47_07675 [Verrucomicrobiales bacterium]|nr:hypothetical protein [Verrucomicrobiales bacterium]
MKAAHVVAGLLPLLLLIGGHAENAYRLPVRPAPAPVRDPLAEWPRLEREITFYRTNDLPARLVRETRRPAALIWPGDRDPLEVLLRRTEALLNHLEAAFPEAEWATERDALAALARQARGIDPSRVERRRAVFVQGQSLRRRIAFRNPLLDFRDIVFLTHHKQGRGEVHMVDQYEGHNARPGGGLYILRNAFSESPERVDVLAGRKVGNGRLRGQPLAGGSFISLELDYDARTAYFAWTQAREVPPDASWADQFWTQEEAVADGKGHYYWSEETCYHIFRAELNGPGLWQLTDGAWNDFDPCVLPSGRLAFISERRGGFLRCGARPNPTFTLHGMMPNGSDIIPLSAHETHEWHPSVTHDGMIVYTRWDYVDRDSDIAHHPWVCHPDGRDPRALHGNYPAARENRPWMELSIRAVPDSPRLVAVAAPHHGENYGSVVLVDPRLEDDGAGRQLQRVTPEVHFPESEIAPGVPGPTHRSGHRGGQVCGQPWPLSEDFFLAVYDAAERHYALCLLDSFGNKIHLFTDPEAPCLDPIPLRPRKRPPVLPVQTTQALADRGSKPDEGWASVTVLNVYDSALPWPAGMEIKAIRVVQVFPKTTRIANVPNIGIGNQSLGRGVLGTAPVEADGSACFELPADVPVYFQALDAEGRAVQSMRSVTYAHRGEHLVCRGCHEPRHATSMAGPGTVQAGGPVLALRRPPSRLTPEVEGSWPLTFSRLVQPLVESRCAGCHAREPDAPGLSAARGEFGWSEAYHTLGRFAWAKHGGNGWLAKNGTSFSVPGKVGALASPLFRHLHAGHHELQLEPAEWRRVTLWLDLNSNFYGVYHDLEAQAAGVVVRPVLE